MGAQGEICPHTARLWQVRLAAKIRPAIGFTPIIHKAHVRDQRPEPGIVPERGHIRIEEYDFMIAPPLSEAAHFGKCPVKITQLGEHADPPVNLGPDADAIDARHIGLTCKLLFKKGNLAAFAVIRGPASGSDRCTFLFQRNRRLFMKEGELIGALGKFLKTWIAALDDIKFPARFRKVAH